MTTEYLQVAQTCASTRALGPGRRAVAWVQGCPFRCRGCIAPEWIPIRAARAMTPGQLAAELLADQDVTGFTFSGGEPMLQAAALAKTIRIARQHRDLSLICFTGYRLAQLRTRPPGPGVAALLRSVDVLIDGQYVAASDHGRGLRGSDNQQVHMLTARLVGAAAELMVARRRTEIRLGHGSALLVGVPNRDVAAAFGSIRRSRERVTSDNHAGQTAG